jgi:Nuclear RNA-splicing-associated protein
MSEEKYGRRKESAASSEWPNDRERGEAIDKFSSSPDDNVRSVGKRSKKSSSREKRSKKKSRRNRQEESSENSSDESSSRRRRRKRKEKKKKQRRKRSSSRHRRRKHDSDSSDTDDSSDDSVARNDERNRKEKRKKREKYPAPTEVGQPSASGVVNSQSHQNESLSGSCQQDSKQANCGNDGMVVSVMEEERQHEAARRMRMVPMTREQYEAEQSKVREVYDPETGRMRLVRGSGEIIERIVSREAHQQINQQATRGDGATFSRMIHMASSGRSQRS